LPEFAGIEGMDYNPTSMSDWVPIAETNHQYPVTKIKWEPYKSGHRSYDLLATTGDYLRLWELKEEAEHTSSGTIGRRVSMSGQQLVQKAVLANVRYSISLKQVETTAILTPLLSFSMIDKSKLLRTIDVV
jgi:hypothetical protein